MDNTHAGPDWEKTASRLRRQLVIERSVIALVLAVLLVRWGYTYVTSSACAIVADGKPIVVVESNGVANELLDEIRSSAGATDDVEFARKIELRRYANGSPMDRESAIAILKAKLHVLADKWVILIDKKAYAAVDAQEQAGETLELARQRFGKLVPNLAEEPSFKENVTVQNQKADLKIWRQSPQEAVDLLFNPEGKASVHVVKSGEIAGEIAEASGMKLAQLRKLNPDMKLDRLRIGDRLNVAVGKTPLTVIVRNQISRIEPIPAGTESITSVRMYAGKRFTIRPGRAGKRQVRVAVVYQNGVQTGREVLEETVLRPPVPKRIAVGVKPRH